MLVDIQKQPTPRFFKTKFITSHHKVVFKSQLNTKWRLVVGMAMVLSLDVHLPESCSQDRKLRNSVHENSI